MSRYFVNDPPVPIPEFDVSEVVSDTAPNIIWIKARMDMQTRGAATSEIAKMSKAGEPEFRLGDQQLALLIHNIIRWEGPDLDNVPCTPENIRKLDPNEPHIAEVLEEIACRNPVRKSPKEGSTTASGSTSGGVVDSSGRAMVHGSDGGESLSLQLATGRSRSPLQSAITGRLSRSDD